MSDEIAVAYIALGGGLAGVFVASIVQWLVTRTTVRAESERLRQQLLAEFHREQFTDWQAKFRETIADLLAATDPELNARFEKAKVVPLVLRAQLMLNPKRPAHARVNSLVNQLALAVNGWEQRGASELLRLHSELLEAARDAMYVPAKQ